MTDAEQRHLSNLKNALNILRGVLMGQTSFEMAQHLLVALEEYVAKAEGVGMDDE